MTLTHILFLLGQDGLPALRLNQLKTLADKFNATFIFYNLSRTKQAKLNQPLALLSLSNLPDDLCLITIEGPEATIACTALSASLGEYLTLITSSHKAYLEINSLLAEHPAFHQAITWQWFYQENVVLANKEDALLQLASLVASADSQKVYAQLVKREQISATEFPGQLALPHIVSSDIYLPTLGVIIPDRPLDWQSASHERVPLIIGIFLPSELQKRWLVSVAQLTRWLGGNFANHLLYRVKNPLTVNAIIMHILALKTSDALLPAHNKIVKK